MQEANTHVAQTIFPKRKHLDMQNREKGDLGQKEARLEKEKTSQLAHMGEKSQKGKGRAA